MVVIDRATRSLSMLGELNACTSSDMAAWLLNGYMETLGQTTEAVIVAEALVHRFLTCMGEISSDPSSDTMGDPTESLLSQITALRTSVEFILHNRTIMPMHTNDVLGLLNVLLCVSCFSGLHSVTACESKSKNPFTEAQRTAPAILHILRTVFDISTAADDGDNDGDGDGDGGGKGAADDLPFRNIEMKAGRTIHLKLSIRRYWTGNKFMEAFASKINNFLAIANISEALMEMVNHSPIKILENGNGRSYSRPYFFEGVVGSHAQKTW